jgi:hypothetical protein
MLFSCFQWSFERYTNDWGENDHYFDETGTLREKKLEK